jgi:uncharacterized protein (DUF305 family)
VAAQYGGAMLQLPSLVLRFALIALVASLALTACAGGEEPAGETAAAESPAAAAGSAEDFNDADVLFAQSMIPHHEQAIEMAEIALDPTVGASPEIVDLATRIQAAQDPEIETMTSWLAAWGEPTQMDASEGHDMSTMDGMMSAEDMDALAAARSTDFDQRWAEMMIAHHEGAISMAEEVQADGTNADVRALAGEIIQAQSSKIAELQQLLGR